MSAVARGDDAAFTDLYGIIAPQVYVIACKVLRDWALAEDVTQEVITEVWRTADRFDAARGSVHGWVLTIAHRRAVDRVRAEQANTNRMMKVGATCLDIAYDQVADRVDDLLLFDRVRCCLECLTDLQRQAVNLAYYHGHTYRAVADLLHVEVPTVKTRIRDGLLRLRHCLEHEHGPSPRGTVIDTLAAHDDVSGDRCRGVRETGSVTVPLTC